MGRWFLMVWAMLGAFEASSEVRKPKNKQEMWEILRTYHERVNPGLEIPQYPETATWVISGEIGGEEVYKEAVPVYYFDELSYELYQQGTIAIGTVVSLDYYKSKDGKLYYLVPDEGVKSDRASGGPFWVEGTHIKKDPERSFKPPKGYSPKRGLVTKVKPRKRGK